MRLLGSFEYTDTGLALRRTVEDEIGQLQNQIPRLMDHRREVALEMLKSINGNALLLYGLNLEILKDIEEEFTRATVKEETTSSGGCTGCFTFASYNDGFESSSPSDGCGGDSGCGSGCGGGCGGD
jgi:hypothetical protein